MCRPYRCCRMSRLEERRRDNSLLAYARTQLHNNEVVFQRTRVCHNWIKICRSDPEMQDTIARKKLPHHSGICLCLKV